jgi:hypothetical protein
MPSEQYLGSTAFTAVPTTVMALETVLWASPTVLVGIMLWIALGLAGTDKTRCKFRLV